MIEKWPAWWSKSLGETCPRDLRDKRPLGKGTVSMPGKGGRGLGGAQTRGRFKRISTEGFSAIAFSKVGGGEGLGKTTPE